MPESTSIRQATDALSVVCDAVYVLAANDDVSGAVRRLEEAAANIEAGGRRRSPDASDTDALAAALRGVKHLNRAVEALASEAVDRGEMELQSAAAALRSAIRMLRSIDDAGAGRDPSSANAESEATVQMSVSEALRVPNEEAVRDALRNLLNRTERGAFVIFADAHSGNFIQCFGSKGEPLVLNLPISDLSDDEKRRALQLFGARDERAASEEDDDDETGGDESFSVNLGRDPSRAAELALATFSRVYGSKPDFTLKIEEN